MNIGADTDQPKWVGFTALSAMLAVMKCWMLQILVVIFHSVIVF